MYYILTFIFGKLHPRKVSGIIGRFSVEKKMVNRRLKPKDFLTPSRMLAGVPKRSYTFSCIYFHFFFYHYWHNHRYHLKKFEYAWNCLRIYISWYYSNKCMMANLTVPKTQLQQYKRKHVYAHCENMLKKIIWMLRLFPLFYTCMCTLNYGCETWGLHTAQHVKRVKSYLIFEKNYFSSKIFLYWFTFNLVVQFIYKENFVFSNTGVIFWTHDCILQWYYTNEVLLCK